MGALRLPGSGSVCIDANVVIYSVEKIEPYFTLLVPLWQSAQAGQIAVLGSELLLLETLVKPLRVADTAVESAFRSLLQASNELRLLPITASILEEAARLRAGLNLTAPDAIHAATALSAGCDLFLTNDATFRRVPGLTVAILDEELRGP